MEGDLDVDIRKSNNLIIHASVRLHPSKYRMTNIDFISFFMSRGPKFIVSHFSHLFKFQISDGSAVKISSDITLAVSSFKAPQHLAVLFEVESPEMKRRADLKGAANSGSGIEKEATPSAALHHHPIGASTSWLGLMESVDQSLSNKYQLRVDLKALVR